MYKKEDAELVFSIIKAKQELEISDMNFKTSEPELVDYYSYQIKANKAKLDYLIKQVKQKGISLNMIEDLEISLYENKAI